ncbi:hypothetical protein [Propionibacterium freudenreichii]|uniref:hypothetical protein n=1 Tax=Propionibacterium freudenreichii TaxID=1744 RepID=UPI0021A672AC|nr:hypothetical protein [Propionibacterium freudenreichii]
MKYRPLVVLGSCALAFGLVAGCSAKPAVSGAGSSASSASSSASPSRSAGEVIDAMMKAMQQATSVRIAQVQGSGSSAQASGSAGASASAAAPVSVVSEGSLTGANYLSDLSLAGGSHVNVLVVDDQTYLQGNDAYWASAGSPEDLRRTLVGKWVSKQAMIDGSTLNKLEPSTVIAEQVADIRGQGFKEVEQDTRDGRQVFRLRANGDAEVVIDAATMLPSHVKVSSRSFPTDLSEWNAVPLKTAPPEDQIVKVS